MSGTPRPGRGLEERLNLTRGSRSDLGVGNHVRVEADLYDVPIALREGARRESREDHRNRLNQGVIVTGRTGWSVTNSLVVRSEHVDRELLLGQRAKKVVRF